MDRAISEFAALVFRRLQSRHASRRAAADATANAKTLPPPAKVDVDFAQARSNLCSPNTVSNATARRNS